MKGKIKRVIAISILVCLIASITATAVSAAPLQSNAYKNNPRLICIASQAPGSSSCWLRWGSSGSAVTLVQRTLNNLHSYYGSLYNDCSLPIYGADGQFGSETDKAVRNYQQHRNIGVDGIVGPTTLYYLDLDQKNIESRYKPY